MRGIERPLRGLLSTGRRLGRKHRDRLSGCSNTAHELQLHTYARADSNRRHPLYGINLNLSTNRLSVRTRARSSWNDTGLGWALTTGIRVRASSKEDPAGLLHYEARRAADARRARAIARSRRAPSHTTSGYFNCRKA